MAPTQQPRFWGGVRWDVGLSGLSSMVCFVSISVEAYTCPVFSLCGLAHEDSVKGVADGRAGCNMVAFAFCALFLLKACASQRVTDSFLTLHSGWCAIARIASARSVTGACRPRAFSHHFNTCCVNVHMCLGLYGFLHMCALGHFLYVVQAYSMWARVSIASHFLHSGVCMCVCVMRSTFQLFSFRQ